MAAVFRALTVFGLVLLAAGPVHGLTPTSAKVTKGVVQVKGKDAAPLALITWEGVPVGQASRSGSFRFETSTLPSDCVGDVSDGAQTAPAVIQFCGGAGPMGPPGPGGAPGEPGSPGPPGPGATVRDGNGAALGLFLGEDVSGGGSEVVRSVGGMPVRFLVNADLVSPYAGDPQDINGNVVFFEADDCSGQPYMLSRSVSSAPLTAAGFVLGKVHLYFQSGAEGPAKVLQSYRFTSETDAPCPGFFTPPATCCENGFSGTFAVAPAARDDLSAFVPPLHVELQ